MVPIPADASLTDKSKIYKNYLASSAEHQEAFIFAINKGGRDLDPDRKLDQNI
jgi:hypothetical protein